MKVELHSINRLIKLTLEDDLKKRVTKIKALLEEANVEVEELIRLYGDITIKK